MIREVYLHGSFKTYHDGPIKIVGNTIAEVVEGVSRQIKGFAPNRNGRQRIRVLGCDTIEDAHKPLGDQVEIHILPQLAGGKKGGFLQILLGAVLLGVGLLLPGGSFLGGLLMKTGAMMLLGGIAQLLAPQPEAEQEEERSRYLPASRNTVAIGTRIPIPYGTFKIGGHYISFNVNAMKGARK